MTGDRLDAVVVGSGPNGLAAAITIARAGRSVAVVEGAATVGGGARSAELTLPGYVHDVCSAIHPLGRRSPFLTGLQLQRHGLEWVEPPVAIGHPLDDGPALLVHRDVGVTAAQFGADGVAYRRLFEPLLDGWDDLLVGILGPFRVPLRPRRALLMARFGVDALRSASSLARRFDGTGARAVVAGAAAHSMLRLTESMSAAAALVMLGSAHADGWAFPRGGAGQLSRALAAELARVGGTIETGRTIEHLAQLPAHRAALFDVGPPALLRIAGDRLRGRYRRALEGFRYGPGVFKLDLAIGGSIPWRDPELGRAGTVHLGGTFEEIARSEAQVAAGRAPERPFVLLAQQSLFDRSRAPEGGNTVWAYCHVPNGSTADMTEPIVRQIERFAPGFRDHILAQVATSPAALERYDPNDVGGDIAGGRLDLRQLFTRPAVRLDPYATPDPTLFLCSASTPPGGGVHGMCGYHAARSALRGLA